ncbi:MAG: DNA topoisomerase IV subunit B [Robiginitomaculum sp.]|nr:MAG: DNA topoisomerase IV subunit B [Robiginitomaculum sp.]
MSDKSGKSRLDEATALFGAPEKATAPTAYTAEDIEVLEGLEPVRKRPGMYIGGTGRAALHHLFAEVLDNAMDEAVAGYADRIEVSLKPGNVLTVVDNGRGIPVDPHPKFKDKSALEVIMTTLHAGGKFSSKVYQTSGGLHGVGVSVVNALSERLDVEVARGKKLYAQSFSRGLSLGKLQEMGAAPNRRGTLVRFTPDPEIFGDKLSFSPKLVFRMARAKAYLQRGVRIRWRCDASLVEGTDTPAEAEFHFPGGLADFLRERLGSKTTITPDVFAGRVKKDGGHGSVEWAIAWTPQGFGEADGFTSSYCNTVPTIEGGTHVSGLRSALTKAIKAYAETAGLGKKAAHITADDVLGTAGAMVSVFITEPEFQGQTKEKLASPVAAKAVEAAVRDPFDHWLAGAPKEAAKLLEWVIGRAEDRLRRRREKEVSRKSATRKLRLPGKLADCSRSGTQDTEIFLVEGDSAGGSAKQARNRKTQAILPLKGKILNVASNTAEKIAANQEIRDLSQALGVHIGARFDLENLRYERVIIMTDADVDGDHIAALLITFFYKTMPEIIHAGRLYLALPPLYRLSQKGKSAYARDDAHREELLRTEFSGRGKVEISRFKGLGEMMPAQLKETTMDPAKRTLARICFDEDNLPTTEALVETLMGKKPELRFQFIQEHAKFVSELDV